MRKNKNIKKSLPANVLPTLTDWDRLFMAYHEAGHAVCSYYLPERETLICITIDPSCEAFGMIKVDKRLNHNETEISLKGAIITFLAGRISEEIFLNAKTTSCIYDLVSARQIAIDMVIKYGMGETIGLTALNFSEYPQISEVVKGKICEDIQKILADAETLAREILKKHKDEVESLAKLLLKKGTLEKIDIDEFFRNRSEQKIE